MMKIKGIACIVACIGMLGIAGCSTDKTPISKILMKVQMVR